jgi:hypothetical protein
MRPSRCRFCARCRIYRSSRLRHTIPNLTSDNEHYREMTRRTSGCFLPQCPFIAVQVRLQPVAVSRFSGRLAPSGSFAKDFVEKSDRHERIRSLGSHHYSKSDISRRTARSVGVGVNYTKAVAYVMPALSSGGSLVIPHQASGVLKMPYECFGVQ